MHRASHPRASSSSRPARASTRRVRSVRACVSEGEWSWNDAEQAMEKQCQETRKLNEAFEAEALKRPDPDGGDLASGQYSENFPSDEEERKCMDWFVVAGLFARVFPAFDT